MNDKPLISVVVPVYNVKDYLGDCLGSIADQSYHHLEIIVVDDGSTDGSAEICDQFAQIDGRMKVIHQENKGVAAARKKAVLCAMGRYICFVDADDRVSPDMIEYMFDQIGQCDLVTAGCYHERADGNYFEEADMLEEGLYDSEESLRYLYTNMLVYQNGYRYGVLPYLVTKMFRTERLKEIISEVEHSLSYAEDGELSFRYILHSKAIRITHECLYYYQYRTDSAMRSVQENYMHELNDVYLAFKNTFEKHPCRETLLHQLQLFVMWRVRGIALRMGFPPDTRGVVHMFYFPELDKDSKVILYGAGKVGMDYYRQFCRVEMVQLVLWADKDWQKYRDASVPVSSPEEIQNYEYDYVIIAVKKKELAGEIKQELVEKGVIKEKILWRVPPTIL